MNVFISYSRDDKAWVYEFYRGHNSDPDISAWLDRKIVPSSDWWESILTHIESADCFVVVLTPRYISSIYCQAELAYALQLNKPILPLLLKSVDVPNALQARHTQYLDITQDSEVTKVLLEVTRAFRQLEIDRGNGKYAPKLAQRPDVPQLSSEDDISNSEISGASNKTSTEQVPEIQKALSGIAGTTEVHSVPYFAPFIGRSLDCEKLASALKNQSVIVIGGLAGIGKTHFLSYVLEQNVTVSPILWLDMRLIENREQFIALLSNYLSEQDNDFVLKSAIQGNKLTDTALLRLAVSRLDEHKYILVWDNFDQSQNTSLTYFMTEFSGYARSSKLLITTREWRILAGFPNPIFELILNPLSDSDAIALMRYLIKGLNISDIYDDEELLSASERVGGHPYFINRLVALLKHYPLERLVSDLPQLMGEVHHYLEEQTLTTLSDEARRLLATLSLLRLPFNLSVLDSLEISGSMSIFEAFELLLQHFLITRQSVTTAQGTIYEYSIHELIKEYIGNHYSFTDISEVHNKLCSYYKALPYTSLLHVLELLHHAIYGNRKDEAEETTKRALGFCMYNGYFDFVLTLTSELLTSDLLKDVAIIYFHKGRVLRFKRQFAEAIECYQTGAEKATESLLEQQFLFELASVHALLAMEPDDEHTKEAKRIFESQLDSPYEEIRLQSLTALSIMLPPDEAIEKLVPALELINQDTPPHEHSGLYQALGQKYLEKSEYHMAVNAFEKANLFRVASRKLSGGQTTESDYYLFSCMVTAYVNIDDFDHAIQYSELLISLTSHLGILERYIETIYEYGRVLILAGKIKKAREVMERGFVINAKHKIDSELQSHFLEWLAVILWEQRNHKLAVAHILDYYQFCTVYHIDPTIFAFISQKDMVQEQKSPVGQLVEYENDLIHLLTLPRSQKTTVLKKWTEEIVQRRPELQEGLMLFYARTGNE